MRGPYELDEQARETLERRAEQARMSPPATAECQLAELVVGERVYALPLSAFRAVVPRKRVTRVPLASPAVLGILRFQGQIITAHSTRALLDLGGSHRDAPVLIVVDPGRGGLAAIDCEEVPRPLAVPRAALDAARPNEAGTLRELATDGRTVGVLELSRLLDRRSGSRDDR